MSGLVRALFFFGDLFFLNLSIFLSSSLSSSADADRTYLYVFSNLTWLFLVMASSPYNVNKGWSTTKIIRSQLAFVFIHLLVVAAMIFFFQRDYTHLEIAGIYLFFVPSFFLWKVITYYFRKVFTPALDHKNYVIIGQSDLSAELRKYYTTNPELGFRFKGYLQPEAVKSHTGELREFCAREDIHEIFYCLPSPGPESLRELVNFGLDSLIKVKMVVGASSPDSGVIQFGASDGMPVQDVTMVPLDDPANQVVKRLFDIVFSGLFLVLVMSWLLPLMYVVVRLDSRGPLFFRQARSGKDNEPFTCLKFRTMVVNKDSDLLQASKNDPRVTRVGAFLRKTSIDELPQFLNVFIGDMSVVGPRPHMLKHTEEYSLLIEQFMGRHYVKPGITGLAQCMGYRGETKTLNDMLNRVRLDRHYIENWSFWLDMKIIVLTVVSLIRGSDKAF